MGGRRSLEPAGEGRPSVDHPPSVPRPEDPCADSPSLVPYTLAAESQPLRSVGCMTQRDPYFNTMPDRQPLLWAAAVRRTLERWEPLVARHALSGLQKNYKPGSVISARLTTKPPSWWPESHKPVSTEAAQLQVGILLGRTGCLSESADPELE
jgi:hypothetical protein